MSATATMRCPDCGHAMPIELTFGPVERGPEGAAVHVTSSGEAEQRFSVHVALNPELHPSFTQVG
jgi:hypothetical protein